MGRTQWIIFCSNHKWWSCFAPTKEDCIEEFRQLFPNDTIIAVYKAKDIEQYKFIENKE